MEVMEPEDAIVAVEEYVHEPGFGGYDFVFVDELSLGQTCSICLVAMRNPVQTMCGHRFCEDCLLGTFRQASDQRICPQDRNPIPEDGGFFRDVAWEREILSLRVQCKKSERGCDWIGQLRHYEGHFNLCHYEDVVCDDCDREMQRRFLEEHMTSQCRNRIVQCEHCGEEFAFWCTEVHEGEKCDRFPLECPQKCGVREIPREEVESHVRDDCLMTIVVCPYEGAGCTFNDKRINLGAHIEESVREHLSKTWSELTQTKQELNEVKKIEGNVEEIQDRLEKLQSEKESMEISLQRNSGEISDLKLSEKKLEVENLSLRKEVTELGRRLTQVSVTTDLADIEHCSLKNLVQTMQIQFKAIQTRLEATEKGEELKAVPKKPQYDSPYAVLDEDLARENKKMPQYDIPYAVLDEDLPRENKKMPQTDIPYPVLDEDLPKEKKKKPQNDIPYPVLDKVLPKEKKKKPQTDIPYPVLDEDLPKEKKQPPGLQKKTEDNPMNRRGRRRYFP